MSLLLLLAPLILFVGVISHMGCRATLAVALSAILFLLYLKCAAVNCSIHELLMLLSHVGYGVPAANADLSLMFGVYELTDFDVQSFDRRSRNSPPSAPSTKLTCATSIILRCIQKERCACFPTHKSIDYTCPMCVLINVCVSCHTVSCISYSSRFSNVHITV